MLKEAKEQFEQEKLRIESLCLVNYTETKQNNSAKLYRNYTESLCQMSKDPPGKRKSATGSSSETIPEGGRKDKDHQFQCRYCPRKLKTQTTLEVHERYYHKSINGKVTKVRTEFSLGEVMCVLRGLSLTSVKLGDYLVVMNTTEDATICGEPYIALQLWLNITSGKVISRIWGQTVACATVVNIEQFMDVCRLVAEVDKCFV